MLFKNKKCSKCSREYEEVLDECPYCSEPNRKYVELGIPKKLVMLPWGNQLALFLIGLIGLVIFQLTFSMIFGSALGESSLLAVLLANVFPYILITIALISSLILHRKRMLKTFRKPYDFLIGFGFGVLLIAISFLYSNLFLSLFNIGVNNNQSVFEDLVAVYPVACLIVFGLVAPFVEELTYRVGLFTLAYRVHKIFAYIIVVIIFGLIHFDFMGDMKIELLNLPNYLIAGLILCLTYRFSGFSGCLTAHTLNNVFSIIFTLIQLKYGK